MGAELKRATSCIPAVLQMGKLDSDPTSGAARTNAGAPGKGAAPLHATTYNPRAEPNYEEFFNLPAVKASIPPEPPERANAPKLPGRKPPGSRPAPKHGHVLDMLSRSGNQASEGFTATSGSRASNSSAGGAAKAQHIPLISRAGRRGVSGAAASSASNARAAQEQLREADSGAHASREPAYRQAHVFDLLNRPPSSSGSYAQHTAQPQSPAGMPAISRQAHQPDSSASPDLLAPEIDASYTLPRADIADLGENPGGYAARQPAGPQAMSHEDLMPAPDPPLNGDESIRPDQSPSSSPMAVDEGLLHDETDLAGGLLALEGDTRDSPGEGDAARPEPAARTALQQERANQLSQIDAATWARLPADVQSRILTGEAVDINTILSTPIQSEAAAVVCLFTSMSLLILLPYGYCRQSRIVSLHRRWHGNGA